MSEKRKSKEKNKIRENTRDLAKPSNGLMNNVYMYVVHVFLSHTMCSLMYMICSIYTMLMVLKWTEKKKHKKLSYIEPTKKRSRQMHTKDFIQQQQEVLRQANKVIRWHLVIQSFWNHRYACNKRKRMGERNDESR